MTNDLDREQEPMFHPDEEASRPGLGRLPLAMAAGGVVAVGCGAVWALIAVYTGYEVGWLAWGLGGLVGLAMIAVGREKSASLGTAAVTMALIGLLVGKLLILPWSVSDAAKDLAKDDIILSAMLAAEMAEKGDVDEELEAWRQSNPLDEDLPPELEDNLEAVFTAAADRVSKMSDAQKKELAQRIAEKIVSEMTLKERLEATVSWWDALWVLFALGTAWSICAGRTEGE